MTSKVCSTCGEDKPLSEYPPDKRTKDGCRSRCRRCDAEYQRAYYARNREARCEYSRRYQREHSEQKAAYDKEYRTRNAEHIRKRGRKSYCENRETRALKDAERRARKAGVPFTLTLETLPAIPDRCPVFDVPMETALGRPSPTSPSLDRIVPSLGYVPDNVVWISHRANRLKSDATCDELQALARFYSRID